MIAADTSEVLDSDKRWIWGLVANQFVFSVVACTRGSEVLVRL